MGKGGRGRVVGLSCGDVVKRTRYEIERGGVNRILTYSSRCAPEVATRVGKSAPHGKGIVGGKAKAKRTSPSIALFI